jgi:hypothetical protein
LEPRFLKNGTRTAIAAKTGVKGTAFFRSRFWTAQPGTDCQIEFQLIQRHCARAPAARRAVSPKRTRDAQRSDRPTPRAAASMSVLRWPHDRHRDFRARLRAKAPARATSSGNQDRHLMMPSPPIDDSYHPCRLRWLAAGRGQTRIRPLDWPVSAPQIPSCNVPTARSPRCAHPGFVKPTAAAASVQPLHAQPRG